MRGYVERGLSGYGDGCSGVVFFARRITTFETITLLGTTTSLPCASRNIV
jgi:hypothetical protein